MTLDEAEANYLESVVDQEELEQLQEEIRARAKERKDERNDALNSDDEWLDEDECDSQIYSKIPNWSLIKGILCSKS